MMSPIYSAAKWGVVGPGKSMALAFAADNIRVNIVRPGLDDTPMKAGFPGRSGDRSEEHTSELKSLMRNSYAVFCVNKKRLHLLVTITPSPLNTIITIFQL